MADSNSSVKIVNQLHALVFYRSQVVNIPVPFHIAEFILLQMMVFCALMFDTNNLSSKNPNIQWPAIRA